MVWTPHQNGRQSLAKEDLPVYTSRQEEKRKTATIMEEPSDGFYEKQKHGTRYGRRQTSLAFGSRWTALGFIDSYIYNYFNGFYITIISSGTYLIKPGIDSVM